MVLAPITVEQMRKVDRLMVDDYGITLVQMMENAGRSLAALTRMLHGGDMASARVLVLVGTGNNGGGGLAAARHLANAGADVRAALVASPPLPSEVPERQRSTLQAMGVAGSEAATDVEALAALLRDTDLILDALIGYSLRGASREPVASWIRLANATTARRIALDLPSGLDRDAGVPRDPTLRADGTLTLAWPKAGLLAPAARSFVGDLYLADISVPEAVYRAVSVRRGDLFAHGPVVRVRPVTGGWEPDEALASA
jgi:NAD(P)H-hydrate epimerase